MAEAYRGLKVQDFQIPMPWGVIAVKAWNSSDLEPILVLHGARHNAAVFDDLVSMLDPNYYYVCVDLPGHGLSTSFAPGTPIYFLSFVSKLQRLIRYFGWDEFSVIGHSFGATIALTLAGCEGRKVKRLILLDCVVRYYVDDDLVLVRCTDELEDIIRMEASDKDSSKVMSYDDHIRKLTAIFPLVERAAVKVLNRQLVKTSKGYYSNVDPRPLFTVMPHMSEKVHYLNCSLISCPVLMVFGNQSPLDLFHRTAGFHSKIIDILSKSHSMSKVVFVDGDHCLHCNQPENVAPVINDFLCATVTHKAISKL